MGCHTWCYRKLNPQPTWDEVVENVLDYLKRELVFNERLIAKDPEFEWLHQDHDEQDYWDYRYELNSKIKEISEGTCEHDEICSLYEYITGWPEGNTFPITALTEYVPNVGFFVDDDTTPHDLFRLGGYPEDRLFSYDETMEYCEKKNIELNGEEKKDVRDFWDKFPDGMINFG
jgi:hypothetical protein